MELTVDDKSVIFARTTDKNESVLFKDMSLHQSMHVSSEK